MEDKYILFLLPTILNDGVIGRVEEAFSINNGEFVFQKGRLVDLKETEKFLSDFNYIHAEKVEPFHLYLVEKDADLVKGNVVFDSFGGQLFEWQSINRKANYHEYKVICSTDRTLIDTGQTFVSVRKTIADTYRLPTFDVAFLSFYMEKMNNNEIIHVEPETEPAYEHSFVGEIVHFIPKVNKDNIMSVLFNIKKPSIIAYSEKDVITILKAFNIEVARVPDEVLSRWIVDNLS